jgi:hypothetical protein
MWLITGLFKYIRDLEAFAGRFSDIGGGNFSGKRMVYDPSHPEAVHSILGTDGYREWKFRYALACFISGLFWLAGICTVVAFYIFSKKQ